MSDPGLGVVHGKRVRPEVPDRVLRVHWFPHRLLQVRALPCVIHQKHRRRPGNNESIVIFIAGSFTGSLFIDLGYPGDLGTGREPLDTYMISRPTLQCSDW